MENFCPSCGRGYPEGDTICVDDGQRLMVVEQEASLIGVELEGKYKLTAELGRGGMGSVYLAHQSSMDRDVAVKVLRRQFSQEKVAISRFLREARAASRLTHPNTIRVYDFGQTADGLLYMVMERLSGCSLADIMDSDGRLAPERSVRILAQVCDSLAEAHSEGITHRDLKPENIFVEQKFGNPEHVKVLDFGIAKMANDASTQATATGMRICGTPSYMSPEQAMGKDIDGRSDVYALGILLFEMLAGERPFDGDSAMEVMLQHLNAKPPALPDEVAAETPPALAALLERMLAKKPADRPESCQVLKEALLACIGQKPLEAQAAGAQVRTRATTRDAVTAFDRAGLAPGAAKVASNRRGWYAAAGVMGVAVGVALWWFVLRSPGASPNAGLAAGPTPSAASAQMARPGPEAAVVPERAAPVEAPAPETPVAQAAPVPSPAVEAEVAPAVVEAPAVEVVPEAPAPAAMVALTVESTPPGAQIFEGEGLLGMTPLTFERPKDSGVVTLTLKLDGYKDTEVAVGTMSNLVQPVALVRVPRKSGSRPPAGADPKKKFGVGTF